jgi:DNA helicase-2/ATP-dependent DNA helicase PcrA
MQEYLKQLNEPQQEAVTNSDGPSLIIAGAGSGKTRVLTYRIVHLLNKGVPAHHILALTFTNKAAKEMKERITGIIGDKAKYLWMGTFHSVFAKILRKEAENIGYPANFTIYDTVDTKSLLKNIVKELQLDDALYKPALVYSRISKAKNNLVSPENYEQNKQARTNDDASKTGEIYKIYKIYADRCFRAGAMDFDDLLLKTNVLFRDRPDILAEYQTKFRYILVDEYQDTNFSQYLIIKKLAEAHHNITVVGDDAQSIYSFRGAKIENIFNFQKDYPEHKLFKLEQNYRSTKNIVNAANSVIAKNSNQIKKEVYSENEVGGKIDVLEAYTDHEEGHAVAGKIFETVFFNHDEYKDNAILYRTNAQSRIFEESLRKRNIPYKIYGGTSFYQRKEIKDLLAYFKLAVNPKDDEAFRRVVNYPKRGIGDTTLAKIEEYANTAGKSMLEVLAHAAQNSNELNVRALNQLFGFAAMIHDFESKIPITDAYDLAKEIAATSGILQDLFKDKAPEGVARHENVQELLNGIKEFSNQNQTENQNEIVTLDQYLENVSLLTNEDNENPEDRNKVTLMTIHSAKGLEFKNVFIVGVEERLFPAEQATFSQKELEEERRLFYVAITRAEKNLFLSFSKSRYRWGTLHDCVPSRFIREIDEKYINSNSENDEIEIEENESESIHYNTKKSNSEQKKISLIGKPIYGKPKINVAPQNSFGKKLTNADEAVKKTTGTAHSETGDSLAVGTKVKHERFGKGIVTEIEGETPNTKATIEFEKSGKKQLLLKFAKLEVFG